MLNQPAPSFEQFSESQKLEHLKAVAKRALAHWNLPLQSELKLLSLSENATYSVKSPDGEIKVMRVHRTHYHSLQAIRSEIEWMRALQTQAKIATPQAILTQNNEYIVCIETAEINEQRFVVLFDWIEGEAPDESQLLAPFKRLGKITAQLHIHAKQWQPPKHFERLIWNFPGCLGDSAHWGDWRAAPGLTKQSQSTLEQAIDLLEQKLDGYGISPNKFGLIHADLRLANLLEVDGDTRIIDFDDAGFGWFLYDLGSALSFIETREDIEDLIHHWLVGYEQVALLTDEDKSMIPSFVFLRRMTLMTWIGSHPETDLARSQGAEFTQGSLKLAQSYIQSNGDTLWLN